ncbi:MAG: formyl transferase [Candidatus Altiarchaeales archaeon HGW-Altiarchaeales-2]|nr:MAG: formyl transferase [Candidatus Altiarchaeales archaeon HGW-Altiarchaeales-2]
MKVLFLGGGELSKNLANWLEKIMKESVVYTEERIDIDFVKHANPEIIISYNYKYILGCKVINYPSLGCINLHISYLPWNRGAHPNVWSFLDDTPKGVTIHYIDEGMDSGDIIVQKKINIDPDKETLRSSYTKLHEEIQKLFKENWIMIKNNKIKRTPQRGGGSIHYLKDFKSFESFIREKEWDTLIKELLRIRDQQKDKICSNTSSG